jgi:transposase-like protein
LGGVGCVVQIDESKFMRLKHNRGHASRIVRRKYWAFGIFDVTTQKVMIKVVRNRRRETIFPIISQYVAPQSIIWSDEFSVYTGGPNYSNIEGSPLALLGPYLHCVVNHSLHYKDPETGVHTNNIEATWGAAKRRFKAMNGSTRFYLQSYVDEYCWRKNFAEGDSFGKILEIIRIN